MPAFRVVDEHLLSPVLVYSGSGGVFENELVLSTDSGIVKTISEGQLKLGLDIESITNQVSKKYLNEIVFNEHVATAPEQVGQFFSLASEPADTTSVQLWLNGQLLTNGDDYTVDGRLIQMLTEPLLPIDKLIASYSRPIVLKQYTFGERLVPNNNQVVLNNLPTSSNDVMIFLNGQLMIRGIMPGDHDYHVNAKLITFNYDVSNTDIVLATYSYS
jgi:hypothetical protein